MSAERILLLEDDPNLGFILKEHLELHGYTVDLRTNGTDGMDAYRKTQYALCLVDVMMPLKDGFTFARELRARDDAMPLIFLTAKSLKEDRVEGLRIGADDYITKPFSMEELMLRIRAVLKRSTPPVPSVPEGGQFTFGMTTFDVLSREVECGGTRQALTSREADLLHLLCLYQGRLLPRAVALQQIWGNDSFFAGRSMDVFVSRLRKRLSPDPSVHIVNSHGKGFRLVVADEHPHGKTGAAGALRGGHPPKNTRMRRTR